MFSELAIEFMAQATRAELLKRKEALRRVELLKYTCWFARSVAEKPIYYFPALITVCYADQINLNHSQDEY